MTTTTNRKRISEIRKAVKRARWNVRVVTIGSGKHCEIGMSGPSAQRLAAHLLTLGYSFTPMSGMHSDFITMNLP